MIELAVNGIQHRFDGDPATPLLWLLRDELGLMGTRFGCGAGLCGCCTVHVGKDAVQIERDAERQRRILSRLAVAFLPPAQKSICALILMKRAWSTEFGVSQAPVRSTPTCQTVWATPMSALRIAVAV